MPPSGPSARPLLLLLAWATAACAGSARRTPTPADASPTPAPAAPTRGLPAVPPVDGPLEVRVVYPPANALIASRDSNFIFGSVGSGRATLTINGAAVPVQPNGSYLAFLPIPRAAAPWYELVVARGADTARWTHPVRILAPRAPVRDTTRLVVDSASVMPRGTLVLRDADPVRVSVRASPGAEAWLRLPSGERVALATRGLTRERVPVLDETTQQEHDSAVVRYVDDATLLATDVPARRLRTGAELWVRLRRDSVHLAVPAVAAVGAAPTWVVLANAEARGAAANDTDRVVNGRPTPRGTYKWFFLPGTVLEATGRIDDFVRVRLDTLLEAWVEARDARPLRAGAAAPRRIASDVQVSPAEGWVDISIPVGARPPYLVEELGSTIVLTLYGTQAATNNIQYRSPDSLVRSVEWSQETSDRVRYTVQLARPPFGYLVLYERDAIVLRVRRAPRVDRRHPLRGLIIAVDAGHPPIGARGPTGLWEPEATLPIAQRVQRLLEERGARVVMTRTSADPVALGDRPVIARRADAHAFVSIHLNALPDGVNPFRAHGTSTYFYRAHSEPLARAVQRGMLAEMQLRNLGVFYGNLAVVRPPWMPAVLAEGAFIMIPEQEAALRTPEFQEAYARGVVEGLEAFFRELADQS